MDHAASLDARLSAEIDARRDDLVALTQGLVRIPTVNPPGREYRAICELLEARLSASGFACTLIRAEGAPGDSNRWPRWNIVARREGRGQARRCISTPISTWSRPVTAGRWTRSGARSGTAASMGGGPAT
jgi:acetylornithine deacetylase/succinyl-diaminopimelate desuccinylase-like protein